MKKGEGWLVPLIAGAHLAFFGGLVCYCYPAWGVPLIAIGALTFYIGIKESE